jgi:hypothetical protein
VSHAQEAIRLRALGFHPIVERPNSKGPIEWAWQKLVNRTEAQLLEAFERAPEGHGLGTITHGFIVVDLDVRPGKDGSTSLFRLESEHGELPRIAPSHSTVSSAPTVDRHPR